MAREMEDYADALVDAVQRVVVESHALVAPHYDDADPRLDLLRWAVVDLDALVRELLEDPPVEPRLVSPAQARVMLSTGRAQIEQMMTDGTLPWVEVAGSRRILIEAVDELCEVLEDEVEGSTGLSIQ